MWIDTARRAGSVSRFHTKPLLFNQNIAEHSFNCCFIMMELAKDVEEVDANKILKYVLCHDLGELYSGDASGSAKKQHPELKDVLDKIEQRWYDENLPSYWKDAFDLSSKEKEIAKFSDILEGLVTACTDVRLGNKVLESAVEDLYTDCVDRWMKCSDGNLTGNVDEVLVWIEKEFENELDKVLEG